MSLKEVWLGSLSSLHVCFPYGGLLVSIQSLDLNPSAATTCALRTAFCRVPDEHNPSLFSVADTVN